MTGSRTMASALRLMALGLLMATTACVPFDNVMVSIFGRSMRDQPSFDPYENPRPAPVGAIPFSSGNHTAGPGQLNLGQDEAFGGTFIEITPQMMGGADPEGLARVDALENPVPADARSLARGEVLFARNCAACHGATGQAESPMTEVWPLLLAYPLTAAVTVDRSDGYLFGIISAGRANMPAYGQRIPYWDRWDVVNYVRTLQGAGAAAPAAAGEPAVAGEGS